VLAQLAEKYPDNVRLVFRHFPLPIHDKAVLAAEASEAAGAQGKFWEFHDLLFKRQEEWSVISPADFRKKLDEYAQETELNVEQFGADLDGGTFKAKVAAALESASTIGGQGLPYTPFILINEQPLDGNTPQEFWVFDAIVQLELLKERQFARAEQVIDPLKQYTATLKTTKGDVVLELYAEQTPLTVNSFVFLAQQGWFDNVQFHRVLPGFVAQSGDPTGTGFGGPGYYVKNEILPELTFDSEGVVGMANSGPDTNGSQFFITYGATPNLDGKYTVFGRVLAGMEVVQQLTPRDPTVNPNAPEGDKILTVIIRLYSK
jgi:cyclophilin family peptidyl-prolyl cis-trans isomerase